MALSRLLVRGEVLIHTFVIGELSLGQIKQRDVILSTLNDLPRAIAATDEEVMNFIERRSLYGTGIGFIDAHLLSATHLTPGTKLWTKDRRLSGIAEHLGVEARI